MAYRVGVDIGGSFTDFALFDEETKSLKSLKVFSRPDQPGSEILNGIKAAGERYGVTPDQIGYFTHGTTVGINTVIQRKGLKLALFTTEGFSDVLEIARLKIPDMYNLLSRRPAPLITRDLVWGIPGRLNFDGTEREPLNEAEVVSALQAAQMEGVDGVVIAFIHGYRNPDHERRAGEIIAAHAPDLPVFLSSATWPIIREYERTITAVIGGYVQPRVSHYLSSLQEALKSVGVKVEPHLTKSNGGIMTAEQGKHECVQMILSGTAAGVIGAAYVAKVAGIEKCMSLDIGGTSADVAIIVDGEPQYGVGEQIGDFQIYIPSVSVASIGEGGGSIAWVDSQNVLRVGPESAGSRPGPACYGKGGTQPTITDAFVVLNLIGHGDLGYNSVSVDRQKAVSAVETLSTQLGKTVEQTAEAIIDIAVSGMYSDVSALVSRFGIDPREFSLLAFGGAGPMNACHLAREIHSKEVVVPPTPGVLSALGGLIADLKNDFIKTVYTDLSAEAMPSVKEEFQLLRNAAEKWLFKDQGHRGEHRLSYSAEMRYRGQSFEIDTPFDSALLDDVHAGVSALADAFHMEHFRVYGHADIHAPIQIISLRLIISGAVEKPEFPKFDVVERRAVPERQVEVYLGGQWMTAAIYQRSELTSGQYLVGPAIITQSDTTTVVLSGFSAVVDEFANIRISEGAAV
ncbi:hydantoinase/oxoprolinase family protein [Rhizobium leguminosarum]|uniref:hydantoinase/oxoprolinase family protein n=1 Tax=Rhizobium leguminosarum TaxID=384 RepID=UPI001C969C6A|nr:hydantoinase/oxoprolinase family protein [Rhizobium leguminosarum]MBY5538265.1 hydantoinase/oxoprolinase family protein [Rhizobium leguminosarum]